jgi:glycosyltransferase 2 family protein
MDDSPCGAERGLSRFSRIPLRSVFLFVLVAVALYACFLRGEDVLAFLHAVTDVSPRLVGEVAALSCASYLARFLRWHGFLQGLGHAVPLAGSLRIYLAGFALTLTPGKAGETIRSVYLQRYGVPFSDSLAAFIVERLCDLLVVGAFACFALKSFPRFLWPAGVGLGACIVLLFLLRFSLLPVAARYLAGRALGAYVERAQFPVKSLLSISRLRRALPLSIVAWTAQGFSLYLIVGALGYVPDAMGMIGIYCAAILLGAVSFLPGGLGVTEGVMVFMLTALGVQPAHAVFSSLLTRGLTLWFAVLVGLIATAELAVINPGANER